MEDDREDDYSKTPIFKIAAWAVIVLIVIALIVTVAVS